MGKVRCVTCSNESSGICLLKKIGVAINKPRLCIKFYHDESKVKEFKEIPTIKEGYVLREHNKSLLKQERRISGTLAQNKTVNDYKNYDVDQHDLNIQRINTKHPLTGDLSRFVSSAHNKQ